MDFGGHPFTLDHLLGYARTAEQLGFDMLCANDHLVFAVPWLDGPTALAAVIEASGQMTLATTVTLVAVRGPVPVAKALAAIDRLSEGRLLVAAGPGSSPATTTASASSSASGGHAWTRRSAPCARCGAQTQRRSPGGSTPPTGSTFDPGLRRPEVRPSGSAAGA
jgi:hypothetical protein